MVSYLEHRTHCERCRLGGRACVDRHAVRHFAFLTVCFAQVSACSRGECCSSRCARSHDHCAAAAIKSLLTRTSMASFCCRTSRTPIRKSPTYVAPSYPPTSDPCILLASLPGHPRHAHRWPSCARVRTPARAGDVGFHAQSQRCSAACMDAGALCSCTDGLAWF